MFKDMYDFVSKTIDYYEYSQNLFINGRSFLTYGGDRWIAILCFSSQQYSFKDDLILVASGIDGDILEIKKVENIQ
jgi:hypothetical protein